MIPIFSAKTVSATLVGFTVEGPCWVTMDLFGTIGSGTVAVQVADDGINFHALTPSTDGTDGAALIFTALGQVRAWLHAQKVRFIYTAGGGSSLSLAAAGDYLVPTKGSAADP